MQEGLVITSSGNYWIRVSQRLRSHGNPSWRYSTSPALGPKVADSDKIAELSKHFELINVYDDEEPDDNKYFPDGSYIPRILFLDADGEVDRKIYNQKGSKEHKYFYYNAQSILKVRGHRKFEENLAKYGVTQGWGFPPTRFCTLE
ncbi:hypothetical protein M8J75_014062 [Diaphorina citri]|nr:hypothetical protein M8J75_014062 [Diaphorina citri]